MASVNSEHRFDVLVVGSGASGLNLALELAAFARVAVITKSELHESNTYYAQGGIAAVLDEHDSMQSHITDTLDAGAGLCDEDVVKFIVEHGRESIEKLASYGVEFTTQVGDAGNNEYHLTREGGHSHRRVVHAADATGQAIETTMEERVREAENVTVFEHHNAVDLWCERDIHGRSKRVTGLHALNTKSGEVLAFSAPFVVLATGGVSKVYLYTSNPDICTGDGIAMAWRAGCRVANMEFTQFHPTCLYHPQAKSFLVSEAVRGEGGLLKRPDGTRFMDDFDPRGELAPRDIVARAIDYEMKRLGAPCMYLDISHKGQDFIEEHFPMIYASTKQFGFDMAKEPLPVVPAAHYTCGGVVVDKNGHTDVEGLYAIGEVTYTGLHGGNRLASNSLLECLVYSTAAARDIRDRLHQGQMNEDTLPPTTPPWDESYVTEPDEEVVIAHNWEELRRFMWDYVGIVRTNKRLARAHTRIDMLQAEIIEYYGNTRVTGDLLELRNLAVCAELIIRCAQHRKESRGLHFTLDYPKLTKKTPKPTVLVPRRYPGTERRSA
ncbi:L-aspartate oxidase [Magnetovibrio blakemorei]|uniref:L-aspartate oxidase n=1 Tax=Magnetovibrio blakemorei TaxID=28181 RepID=A0A1E5QAS0_9PROT|nr:L-aspartate oxidase [Magnetovibrio blakemorei]